MKKFLTFCFVIVTLASVVPLMASDEKPGTQPHELILNPGEFEIAYGNPDAAVVLKDYSSLSCPHCKNFNEKVIDNIKASYFDSGKVYYLFRFFPLGMPALKASMLVHCLTDEKQKIDFVTLLFREQAFWTAAETETEFMERVTAISKKIGIETAGFEKCVNNETIEDKMLFYRMQLIEQAGLRSTPTIYINNEEYVGPRELEPFTAALDNALQNAATQQDKKDNMKEEQSRN